MNKLFTTQLCILLSTVVFLSSCGSRTAVVFKFGFWAGIILVVFAIYFVKKKFRSK